VARYLIRRLLATIPVLILVSVIVFSLIRLVPGDPITILLGESYDQQVADRLRQELGLDRPIYLQYGIWLGRLAQGDLGRSIRTNQPVLEAVGARVRPTVQIASLALLLSVLIALPLGVVSATRRGTISDAAASGLAVLGVSAPTFLIGLLLIFVFAGQLHWFPTSGYTDIFQDPVAGFKSMVMPAVTLALGLTAVGMRMTRSSLLEALNQDYIRTARSKGLHERAVVLAHGLRNALIPLVTILGLQMGSLMAGTVITETVFAIPGVGRLVVDSIFARDYPILQGVVLLTAFTFIVSNLVADLLYAALDPRIRLD
jgi:peptide/nickel transport system permease protein